MSVALFDEEAEEAGFVQRVTEMEEEGGEN